MKKLLLLFMTAVTMLTTSCSKQTTLQNRLDGETWKVTKMDLTSSGITTSILDANQTNTFSFDKDGKGTMKTTGEADEIFTWSVSEDGKTVTLTMSGEQPTVLTVIENSSKKQVWTMNQTENGVPMVITITLEKQ